jgi:RNA-directed DNA polymerase
MMNGAEGSGLAIVAMKPANKSSPGDAERAERRARTEGTPEQQSTCRTQSRESVTQALDRIRQAARTGKGEKFTSLFHHISPEMLMTAYYALSRKAAAGVDGMTWA